MSADEQRLQDLVDDLTAAQTAAAEQARTGPLGVRAVVVAEGQRSYLCAFEGPRFLCLGADGRPLVNARAARQVAVASLLWEHAEAFIDAVALDGVAQAVARYLALNEGPAPVGRALERLGEHCLGLAHWRADPLRAIASVPDLDRATALHEQIASAWGLYVKASEPLVEVQHTLPVSMIGALRAVERHPAKAGVIERLAAVLARAMPSCDREADQIIASHITPLA